MMIHDITKQVGKHRARKRVGRGHGSGLGKTSGRGHKGAGQRAGYSRAAYFEGGQMSFARRIPKRGFTNAQFRRLFHVVNVKVLEERCEDGADVNVEVLAKMGIVRDTSLPLKILGEGALTKKLNITAAKFSAGARKKIEAAGGTMTEVVKQKWTRPEKKKPKATQEESA